MRPAERLRGQVAAISAGDMGLLSDRAGLPRKTGMRARAGNIIPAREYMRLCACAGLDPATGKSVEPLPPGEIVWPAFACGLILRRMIDEASLRDAAYATGLAHGTLVRAERGEKISADSSLRLVAFIRVDPRRYIDARKPAQNGGQALVSHETTRTEGNARAA